jgi:putative hemolysin
MVLQNMRTVAIAVALALTLAACASTTPVAAPPAAAVPAGQEPSPAGYRRVVRNSEEYFCQIRSPTGSRARSVEICLTRDQIRRMQEVSDQIQQDAASSGSHSTLKMDSP